MTTRQPDYIVITASNPTQAGNYEALVKARIEAVRCCQRRARLQQLRDPPAEGGRRLVHERLEGGDRQPVRDQFAHLGGEARRPLHLRRVELERLLQRVDRRRPRNKPVAVRALDDARARELVRVGDRGRAVRARASVVDRVRCKLVCALIMGAVGEAVAAPPPKPGSLAPGPVEEPGPVEDRPKPVAVAAPPEPLTVAAPPPKPKPVAVAAAAQTV